MRQGRMGGIATDFEQLLLRGKYKRDRPMLLHEGLDHPILQDRLATIRRPAVRMYEHIIAPICDKIAIARHLQIAGVFAVERNGVHGSAFELPAFSMCQLDYISNS